MPPSPRVVLGGGLSVLVVGAAMTISLLLPTGSARAACGDTIGDPDVIFAFDPPVSGFEVSGPAPLTVTVTWVPGAVVPIGSTGFLDWGDGSAFTPFTSQDCGDGFAIDWPPQTHAHTYTAAASYTLSWSVNSTLFNFSVPIAFVVVGQATPPTATATATPPAPDTPTPSPAAATTAPATIPTTVAASISTPAPTASPLATPAAPSASRLLPRPQPRPQPRPRRQRRR